MITGIQHFSFTVSNLEETIHFFRDILALQVALVTDASGPLNEKLLKMPGVVLKMCFINTPDNGTIEFIEYKAPKGKKIDLTTCNTGVAHIAFKVDNIQKMYKDLSAKGVQFSSAPIRIDSGPVKGWNICYLKGPDGITLEFVEAPGMLPNS